MDLNLNTLMQQAAVYKKKAEVELRPLLITAAEWLVKVQLFLNFLMERFRKIDWRELQLYKLAIFLFGFLAGICAPRRYRKFKVFILIAALVSAAAFIYRLLTKESE